MIFQITNLVYELLIHFKLLSFNNLYTPQLHVSYNGSIIHIFVFKCLTVEKVLNISLFF